MLANGDETCTLHNFGWGSPIEQISVPKLDESVDRRYSSNQRSSCIVEKHAARSSCKVIQHSSFIHSDASADCAENVQGTFIQFQRHQYTVY